MFKLTASDYIYPEQSTILAADTNLYLPIEIDTEYTHPAYDLNNPSQEICTNITVQCRAISHKKGLVYAHPDIADLNPRHKVFRHGFAAIDYLEDYGYNCKLSRLQSWNEYTEIPWLQVDIISFFAIAETLRIFQGVYRDDVLFLITNPSSFGIEQGRRLRTFTRAGNQLLSWVEMPWVLNINGFDFRVRLNIFDTCAIHGIANYASFCNNSGVKLEYKDNFTNEEKSVMSEMYFKRAQDFDNYALGDLYNHDALMGNAENFGKIYEALGIEKYYTHPRLTIGATVSRMVEAVIKNLFDADINDRNVINAFCKYGSADWLKRKSTTTACLNAKVDGGRCRNNKATVTNVEGLICDIDISGCYGEGLRTQLYPLGIPIIIDYPIKSEHNHYTTLRTFLKKYGKDLVPGLWQARVSIKEGTTLNYKQDYLASWFPPNDLSKLPTDSDFAETDQWWTVDNVGEIKIFTNEITHAIITHDFIQWLDNVASERQRKELLDNLLVETAMMYPASERVDSVDELKERHIRHTGKNTTEAEIVTKRSRKISIEMECHAWYGINLGELLVDNLLLERKKYQKKTPLNDLYKLCTNTVYGDMVSPFFTVGNVVVGNNITARARALAWCMEKGLNGFQSITDGCAFEINRVLYPRRGHRITGELVVNLYAIDKYSNHSFRPLVNEDELSVTDNRIHYQPRIIEDVVDGKTVFKVGINKYQGEKLTMLSEEESIKLVDDLAMKHLQKLFPGLDVLHKPSTDVYGNERLGLFQFESKGFFTSGTFHGSANYSLSIGEQHKFAMRSYSKRGNKLVVLGDDLQVINRGDKPSENFLLALREPRDVKRSDVALKERILKVGDYRRNYSVWKDSNVYPGCTIETAGLLHEFSLSQFTFKTYAQYKSWKREFERLLNKYGQSYEMFFLSHDGTLDYQLMINTIDASIRKGSANFFDGLDKRSANMYRDYLNHQNLKCLNLTRFQLSIRWHGKVVLNTAEVESYDEDTSNPYQSDD
jgi:hypothetical protein